MSNVVSHKVYLRMISTLHASYDMTNLRRYENTINVFMDLEAIKNKIYYKKVITSLKKLYAALNTFFLFLSSKIEF